MKRYFYVYIPGFTYKSRGPLHIDAIRLEASLGKESSTSTGGALNKLQPYSIIITLSGTKNRYEDENSVMVECDVIYRTSKYYQTNKLGEVTEDPCGINAVDKNQATRSAYGWFYDFLEYKEQDDGSLAIKVNDDGTYTHTLTFRNQLSDANSSGNLEVDDHDGLYILKINNIDSDINLHFTLYSRMGTPPDAENDYTIGIEETYNPQDDIHMRTDTLMLSNGYIIIGTFDAIYNPMTSVLDYAPTKFEPIYTKQLYDVTKDESYNFDLPVNTGFLVAQNTLSGTVILEQLKYNISTKKFISDSTLKCNQTLDSSLFGNWYNQNISNTLTIYDKDGRGNDAITKRTDGTGGYEGYSTYQLVNKCIGAYTGSLDNQLDYNIIPVNLSTLTYLYKTNPDIQLYNLSDTYSSRTTTYIKYNSGKQYITDIGTYDEDHKDILFDIVSYDTYYHSPWPSSARSLPFFVSHKSTPAYTELNCTNLSIGLKQSVGDITDSNYYNGTYALQSLSGVNSYYDYSSSNHITNTTFKGTNTIWSSAVPDSIILKGIKPSLTLQLGVFKSYIPYIYFGEYSTTGTTGSGGTISEGFQNKIDTYVPNNTVDKFPLTLTINIEPYVAPTYIDLSQSNITYTNKSNYTVSKILYNDTQGFVEKSLMPYNIYTTNLLNVSPLSTGYEIANVVNESLKTPKELGYGSTICNERRFVSCKNNITLQNSTLTLGATTTTKAYIFKIEDSLFSDDTFSKDALKFEYTVTINNKKYTTYGRKLLILQPTSTTGSSLSISNIAPSSAIKLKNAYISNIGLYQVDLTGTTLNTLEVVAYIKKLGTLKDFVIIGNTNKSSGLNLIDKSAATVSEDVYIINDIVFPACFTLLENIDFLPSNGILDKVRQYSNMNLEVNTSTVYATASTTTSSNTTTTTTSSTTTSNKTTSTSTSSTRTTTSYNSAFDANTIKLYTKYKNYGVDLNSDTAVNMLYNFTYLPENGIYETVGKYKITDKSGTTSNNILGSLISLRLYTNTDIKSYIEGTTVRK